MTAEQRKKAHVPSDDCDEANVTDVTNVAEKKQTEAHADHLSEVPDGSGCTEIWEHLSKEREDDD